VYLVVIRQNSINDAVKESLLLCFTSRWSGYWMWDLLLCEYTVVEEREIGASLYHKLLIILELMEVVPKLCFVGFLIYPKGFERLQEYFANVVVYVCCFLRYLIV